jgi:hypothetical protein
MPEYDKYTKVLDLYQRPDNALFVGETGNSAAYPRYFFPTLGHQGIDLIARLNRTRIGAERWKNPQLQNIDTETATLVYGAWVSPGK